MNLEKPQIEVSMQLQFKGQIPKKLHLTLKKRAFRYNQMLDCNSNRPERLIKKQSDGLRKGFPFALLSHTQRGFVLRSLICGHVWKQICSVWPTLAGGKSMHWLGEQIEFLIKTTVCKKNNRHWILISVGHWSRRIPRFPLNEASVTSQPDNGTDLSLQVYGCDRSLDVKAWMKSEMN